MPLDGKNGQILVKFVAGIFQFKSGESLPATLRTRFILGSS
jgi:hypothetical protein